jgi:hypothetical protein
VGADEGASVWVAAVDTNGRVVTDYYGTTVNFNVTTGTPTFEPSSYMLSASDNGQFQVVVKNSTAEMVTFNVLDGTYNSPDFDIIFTGVTQYLVDGLAGNQTFNTGAGETQIKFIIQAADAGGFFVRSYNKTATFSSGGSSYLTGGSSVEFHDGVAEIVLNSGGAGSDSFSIVEDTVPWSATGSITVDFTSADSVAPEVIRAEMDTPWIIHLYFDEDLDSATAGVEGNYTGIPGATVDKVCWYGDNVTLHLSAIPTSSPFTVTIDGVQDQASPTKNTMSSYVTDNITVPDLDYTGGPAGGGTDWFEIQVSDTSPSVGDTVHVTVYHKNVCGYLTGSNNVNKNTTVGTVSISYTGQASLDGTEPSSVNLSSGQADFDVKIDTPGTVTISASGSGVTTSEIATLNIP